jgi:predicted transcriptional regulator
MRQISCQLFGHRRLCADSRRHRQQEIIELLRANNGALCIAAICTALPISRGITRSRLREMERAGLVVIEDVGRRTVGVGYSDGSLVKLATVAVAGPA